MDIDRVNAVKQTESLVKNRSLPNIFRSFRCFLCSSTIIIDSSISDRLA